MHCYVMTELQAFAEHVLSFPGLQMDPLAHMAHELLDLRTNASHFLWRKSIRNLLSLSIIHCDQGLFSVNIFHCRLISWLSPRVSCIH